jgi:hypothetical protein
MQGTFLLLDQAIASWQAQTGRELTFGRIAVPAGTNGPPDFELGATGPSAAFDIYEENFTVVNGTYAICVLVERLASNPDSAEILSKIPSSMFRSVPKGTLGNPVEALPAGWPSPAPNTDPNQMPSTDWTLVREICDPWGKRIRVVFPGRPARPSELSATGTSVDREDGSVRTEDEYRYGVCRGRKICFMSAGPDGDFGEGPDRLFGTPDDTGTEDNITSYELLPRPQP